MTRTYCSIGLCVGVAFVTNACSAILNFEEDGRPCDENGKCIEGYSCMVNVCVKNNSKKKYDTCTVNEHCEHSLACISSEFVCLAKCDRPYGGNQCSDGEICVALVDSEGARLAVCIAPDCRSVCDGGQTCVRVEPDAGYCMDECCVGATCSQNCAADEYGDRACQPMGPWRTYACVSRGDGNHGDSCNAVYAFCDATNACIMSSDGSFGSCTQYCQDGDPCTGLEDPARPGVPAVCTAINGAFVCGSTPADT